MDPSVWAPHLWRCIHLFALNYPEVPSADKRAAYRQFYIGLQHVIPCSVCAENYQRHLKEIPIDPYLVSSARLFEWTVLMHNAVNRELGKQEWTLSQARALYTETPANLGKIGWVFAGAVAALTLLAILVGFLVKLSSKKGQVKRYT